LWGRAHKRHPVAESCTFRGGQQPKPQIVLLDHWFSIRSPVGKQCTVSLEHEQAGYDSHYCLIIYTRQWITVINSSMPIQLITYDLKKEKGGERDYAPFYDYIKKHDWVRLSESSYAIATTDSAKTIYEALKPHVDENDNVLVMRLDSPCVGQNQKHVVAWLEKNLLAS
jgi:CRISPR-associated endonuclease Cas2